MNPEFKRRCVAISENKWVIFDVDGTLLDVSVRRKLARLLASEFRVNDLETDSDLTVRNFMEERSLLASDRVYEGIVTLLDELYRIDNLKLAVYTARQKRPELLDQLENLGLIQYFSLVINTGGAPKSHKDLQIGDISGNVLAYLGDTEEDREVSMRAGAHFISIPLAIARGDTPDLAGERSFFSEASKKLLIKLNQLR